MYKEYVIKAYPQIEFIKSWLFKTGVNKSKNDEFFGLVGILPVVGHEIQKRFLKYFKISKEIFNLNFSMATSKR